MTSVSVELTGFREIEGVLQSASGRVMQKAQSAMTSASRTTRDAVRSHTPVRKRGVGGGETQKSIVHKVTRSGDSIEGEIYSNLDDQIKVKTIELGRAAGSAGPPIGVLMSKYGITETEARQFAHNISAKDQPAHLMFQSGFNDVQADIITFFEIVLDIF